MKRLERRKPSRVGRLSRAHKMGCASNLQEYLYSEIGQKSSTERLKEQWLPAPGEKILIVGESDRSISVWIHNEHTGQLSFIPSPYGKGGEHNA